MSKKLTIGMAVYDDFDGVFFSIQALRMYQRLCSTDDVEFIVVDNNPDSASGKAVSTYVKNWVKGKYIPYTEKKSTTVRNLVFENATGDYTLCMDSHVLVVKDGIDALMDYYKENPDTKDILSGPLIYDDLVNMSTHFEPVWRDHMYGIWGTNNAAYEAGVPFEIPMQGLGLFSCKTSNWRGFNKNFRGFGGEEGYIHEKFRQAGGRAMCLPGLKWNHRFSRPAGVKYPLALEDRVWNYFVGWLEIYNNSQHQMIQDIYNHFKDKLPAGRIDKILNNAIAGKDNWTY
jgi:glycosyltransferase involved in cell wall biosynthesis